MNIMVVSSGLPTEKYPMLGIFELDQAKALQQEGNKVTFLVVDLRSVRRWRKWGFSKGQKDGVDCYVFNFPCGRIPLKYLCAIGTRCLKIIYKKALKDNGNPDIFHAHFTEMGCITSRVAQKEGIPYVVTEHSSKMNQYNVSDDLNECAKEAYGNASAVISVGTALANNIYRHTGYKPVVIPNIIDTKLFSHCQRKEHKGFNLVTTSNLITLKRTWQILQALSMIDPDVIDFHLTVIGDGSERDSIVHWRNVLNLAERVSLVGYQPREIIANIYETADVFILVSSTETFGVAYVEAMAAGLPVIATKCGGPEDFVTQDNGILVEVDNINQMAYAIQRLYNYYENYDSAKIKKQVEAYSPNVIAGNLMEIYKSILR